MNKEKIWLSSPHMGGTEQNYVNEAFATNWIAPLGPNVSLFENKLENFIGQNKYIAALSSGTAALHLALVQLNIQPNDEVICQSFTFAASAFPIFQMGATPVFVDSEVETWNMCPVHLKIAIEARLALGKKIKAIIVVHLYGMPAKMDEILQIASEYKIPLIEDAAEALGSNYKSQKCGTFGQFGVLSFNGNKIITTSGGGALVCNGSSIKEKTIFLATQARDAAPHYQHSEVGYNYRLSNISAGIGCGQMEVLSSHILKRTENNQFYTEIINKISGITILKVPNADFVSNFWLTAILCDSYEQREALRLAFEAENIETRPLWKPMHLQPLFANQPFYGANISEDLFNRGLCLPSGSNLTKNDLERINQVFINFFNLK
jgi:dTDP-4-amino-4,6-dideoxygalactose transaminase